MKSDFLQHDYPQNPTDTWCLFELLHASHSSLLGLWSTPRLQTVRPSLPLVGNKKTHLTPPRLSSSIRLTVLFCLQGDKACRSVSLQLASPINGGPLWSVCMALMLSPARALKLNVFSTCLLNTMLRLSCSCWTPTTDILHVGTRTEVDRV